MFGRPPRDTGLESERNNRPTPAQRLHMLNSSHVQRKLEQGRLLPTIGAMKGKVPSREIVEEVYLTVLSRFPTDEELTAVGAYCRSGAVRPREAMVDLAWALVNSAEFLYRH
jgi:hypothetical protein